jgi:hypothetical protein
MSPLQAYVRTHLDRVELHHATSIVRNLVSPV